MGAAPSASSWARVRVRGRVQHLLQLLGHERGYYYYYHYCYYYYLLPTTYYCSTFCIFLGTSVAPAAKAARVTLRKKA